MLTKLRKKSRGSILLLVLFLLIILAMMGSAFAILLPVEMSNAKRDRANIQTAYAADAGVLWVMEQFDTNDDFREADGWKDLEGETQILSNEWEWRVVSVDRLTGEEAYRVVTDGIRIRGAQKDVLRRAVAIIDNGLQSQQPAILVSSASPNTTGAMGGGLDTYWPGDVPIYGDVLVSGHWAVDDNKIDFNNGPTFTGTVTQTVGGGNGLRGESYDNALDSAQYDQAYTNGIDGVQTVDANDLSEAIYLSNDETRQRLQEHLFITQDTDDIEDMNDETSSTAGIHVPVDSSGVASGGVVINLGGGNNNGTDNSMLFSVDTDGNSVINLDSGGGNFSGINTITSSNPGTLTATGSTVNSSQFRIVHVTEGSSAYGANIAADEDVLVITDNNGTVIRRFDADFSNGVVVYNEGSISAQGTFSGQKTVAAAGGVSITGEILKDGLARGDAPTNSDNLLGFIANMGANTSSEGMRVNITSPSADNVYHIYASIMGLAKTDVNSKIFGHNLHGTIPANAEFNFYGQLASGPSNNGQFKKEIAFIDQYINSFTMDDLPIGWPSRADGFRANIRAYVDQQSYETD